MASWSDALSGLFQGTPQAAPSYSSTTSDVPKWLQDYTVDLFSQQRAVSSLPYQSYQLPRIAQTTDPTKQAYETVQNSVGDWQNATNAAAAGTAGLASGNAGLASGMGMLNTAAGYNPMGAAAPYMQQSGIMANAAGNTGTADALANAQGAYLDPSLAGYNLNAGRDVTGSALGYNAVGAASPYMDAASQSSASNVGSYMNPYNSAVTDQIAKLGARNLTENLLPGVSDQFIRAGSFGGSRMGEFGNRAVRDTQESILGQQAQALQQGYGQALTASQTDLGRQAQLGSTMGNLTQAQQNAMAGIGQQYTAAGQAQQNYGLTAAQAEQQAQQSDLARQLSASSQIGTIGQNVGALTAQQQQNLANIGQNYATLGLQGGAQQLSALGQMSDIAKTQQGLAASDAAALQSIGQEQQNQTQKGLDVAYQDFMTQQQWPQQQINNMSTTLRGLNPAAIPTTQNMTGATTQFSPSPLSQVASAYFTSRALGS
jgi:hypothetical protein